MKRGAQNRRMPFVGEVWDGTNATETERKQLLQAAMGDAIQELPDGDARNLDGIVEDLISKVQTRALWRGLNAANLGAVGCFELLAKLGIFLYMAEKDGYDLP